MDFKKFDFPLPNRGEIKAVIELVKSSPEDLDGRDMWIFREFLGCGVE